MENTLEKYRIENGLTYQGLACAAGMKSRGMVFLHCTGKRKISPESAITYCEHLGISRSELRPDLWPPTSSGGSG